MRRRRPVPILSMLLALVAALALGVTSSRADTFLPTLYVNYTMNCTFQITNDAGTAITQIAPGAYQLFIATPVPFGFIDLSGIDDMTACKGFVLFSITGPGVNISTDLEFGDNATDNSLRPTFLPSSSYVAQDGNQPTVARKVFTTAASGSPTSPTSPSTSSSSGGKGTVSTDVVGSAKTKSTASPLRGTLAAAISAAGKLTLTLKGKPVSTLKYGRYTFAVTDKAAKSSFTLQEVRKQAMTLTSVSFVGKRTVTVDLKVGQWMAYSGSGKKFYFIVSA